MPAQRAFTIAEYLGWTDNYARAIAAVLAATGNEDTPATAAYYTAAVRDAINGFTAPDTAEITIDLLPAAFDAVSKIATPTFLQLALSQFNSAILTSLGSDLNAWITVSAAGRVSYLFKKYGNPYITATNTFPPVTVLGSIAVTGSGAGTFTDVAKVDTANYGGAQIACKVIDGTIGAADIHVTAHVTLESGSTTTVTGTIPNGSGADTIVALGSGSDKVVDVTSVTFTGGTEGDAFQVETILERSLDA